jgi:hypothetical protein
LCNSPQILLCKSSVYRHENQWYHYWFLNSSCQVCQVSDSSMIKLWDLCQDAEVKRIKRWPYPNRHVHRVLKARISLQLLRSYFIANEYRLQNGIYMMLLNWSFRSLQHVNKTSWIVHWMLKVRVIALFRQCFTFLVTIS